MVGACQNALYILYIPLFFQAAKISQFYMELVPYSFKHKHKGPPKFWELKGYYGSQQQI